MKVEILNFDTANGPTTAYVAMPDNADANSKAIVLIQEWWGLNDHIKDIAARYAESGFVAIAPDLYRGKVTKDPQEASKLMHNLSTEDGLDTIKCAVEKAKETYGITKFGITGYCMGGTFALRAACDLEEFSAAVPFYGDIPDEEVLKRLHVPTIFIAGQRDAWITPAKVAQLETAASKNDLPVEVVSYDADHAFFNDTRTEVYDASAARDAWKRAVSLFNEKL
jgi:carboxymethylenebutenolidase